MIPLFLNVAFNNVFKNSILTSSTTPEEKFYTTKEVSEILGITEYTVRKKIREGDISAVTFPGHAGYRVKHEALKDYINIHSIHAPDRLSSDELSQPVAENFTSTMHSLSQALKNHPEIQTDTYFIQTFIDGKKIDLECLLIRLRLLELDEDDTIEFQRKKFSLELAINQLKAEVKACELFKLAIEKNIGAETT